MEKLPSTKPYLLRAIWEWCTDNGLTPHIAVAVDGNTRVPREFVRDGQIVLNVGSDATHKLTIGNEFIEFQARFGGVARDLSVPVGRVTAIYARENGAGMAFDLDVDDRLSPPEALASADEPTPPDQPPRPEGGRPKLQRIK
jgi:stringent starvation protein B